MPLSRMSRGSHTRKSAANRALIHDYRAGRKERRCLETQFVEQIVDLILAADHIGAIGLDLGAIEQ